MAEDKIAMASFFPEITLKPTDVFEKNKSVSWRRVEEQAILIDPDEGELLRLTPVGAAIWEALDGEKTVEEVITCVRENFEAESERIRRDVFTFLKQLRSQGLIE